MKVAKTKIAKLTATNTINSQGKHKTKWYKT